MASLVHIDTKDALGAEVAAAIDNIRDGLAVLKKYDGMRAETIAVSAATFGTVFGVADATEAQAFSDRLGALNAGTYTGLPDIINATISGPGV